MDRTSEALFELKPVAFRYQRHRSGRHTTAQLRRGLALKPKVNPDLVVRDNEGSPRMFPLDPGERHVTQRVPQRAPNGAEYEIHCCKAGSDDC